jgi:diguanylate cyclase (GGDEF)-like protein
MSSRELEESAAGLRNQARLKLLLAEDEPLQRRVLEWALTKEGYDVESVSDGEEALARLLQGQFNILVTDWDMPTMDGPDLCRRIRAAKLPGYLYILMLTEHSATSDLILGLGAGANDFVSKPPKMPELIARVQSGRRIVYLERSLREANEKVQKLSITDALADTYNRRYLNEQLPRETARSIRYGHPLSVVMADIDHFKEINDVYGHDAGDQAIRHFAHLMTGATRHSVDWVARYGGEEFVLVLPETELQAAALAAEKIRRECAAKPMDTLAAGTPITFTASFGVAALRRGSTDEQLSADTLLREADALMYRSKRDGRNRVTVAVGE